MPAVGHRQGHSKHSLNSTSNGQSKQYTQQTVKQQSHHFNQLNDKHTLNKLSDKLSDFWHRALYTLRSASPAEKCQRERGMHKRPFGTPSQSFTQANPNPYSISCRHFQPSAVIDPGRFLVACISGNLAFKKSTQNTQYPTHPTGQ